MKKNIVVLGDTHYPFHSHEAIKWVFEIIKKENPRYIVQVGDLYDGFSFSRFPKKPGLISPQEELLEGRRAAEFMWNKIKEIAPRASLYQLLGNHCVRPTKLIIEKCPEIYPLMVKSWEDLFKFKGVNTILDDREELIINNIVFEHGHSTKPGYHMKYNMKSTIIGHSHSPWIVYQHIRDKLLFELNVGYLADPTSPALQYTKKKWTKWTQGIGLVKDGYPIFLPYKV